MTLVISRTRRRATTPEESHVEPTRQRNRARDRTLVSPVADRRALPSETTRSTVRRGIEKVWEARQTIEPSATKHWMASETPWHLVGWTSHPKRGRMCSIICAAERVSLAVAWANIKSSRYEMRRTPTKRRNQTVWPMTVEKIRGAVDRPKGRTKNW